MGMASARFRSAAPDRGHSVILMGMWVVFLIPGTPRGLAAIVALNIDGRAVVGLRPRLRFRARSRRHKALATGAGLSNMGGFLAAMMAAQGIGLLLDASSDGRAYQWADFRVVDRHRGGVGDGHGGLITAMIARRRISAANPVRDTVTTSVKWTE